MVAKDPFHIGHSPAVASIPCVECGHNMHCMRRSPVPAGEHQQFACASCGATCDRIFAEHESDSDIQREAEHLCGIPGKAA